MIRLLLILTIFISTSAQAQILTRCGGSTGTAYFFPGPYVPKDKAGWQKDRLMEGEFLLKAIPKNNDVEFDIISKDTVGTKSSKDEGGTVFGIFKGSKILVMSINVSSSVIEHYLFDLDND